MAQILGAEILGLDNGGSATLAKTGRPLAVNKRTGEVRLRTVNGLFVNSMLRKSEWAEVDRAVIEAARYPLRAVEDLRSRGLVVPLGGIGTLVSQWYSSSEMTAADINMSGTGKGSRDLPDLDQHSVPVPVVFKDFTIDARVLEASRRMGDGLDVTAATEATRVVAEALETLLVTGASTAIRLNGAPLYGYRTHPSRNTDTAANFGGGDWGTIANITPTVAGMISAANADYHYGPFVLYASTTQYNEAALAYYTDGSAQTPLQRIKAMPQIADVQMLPSMAAGELLLVQMTREVVEWAEALDIQVREWTSGDGFTTNFKVLAVATPRVKARYDGKSGVIHATGA